jgi:membrane-bound serine protease (ClpP class)
LIVSMAVLVVVLMVVGLALLAIEILVIPGFGAVGLLGIASIAGGCALAWTQLGAAYGMAAIASGLATAGLLFWLFPRSRIGKAMVLRETQRGGRAGDARLERLVGSEGKALTPLRPAGSAEIGDATIDVVTDGVYVEAGAPVRVVKVQGARVVVEPRSA